MMTRGSTIWWLPWLLVVVAAFPLSAAQPLGPARPAAGLDTVVIGILQEQEPQILHPLFSGQATAIAVLTTVFTPDAQRDEKWRLFPVGVEYLPNVKDGTWKVDGETMTLTWKLKPRLWHDGRRVTCADYIFTYNVAKNEDVRTIVDRSVFGRIANIACPTGATGLEVAVNWRGHYPYAHEAILGDPRLRAVPSHLLGPLFRSNPTKLRDTPFGHDPHATIGDGPYRIVKWQRGRSLTVQSLGMHPILGDPQIKRITWRFMPPEALVANMLSGAIDAISGVGVPFGQAIQLERQANTRYRVFFEPGLLWEHIDFNLDNPLLADIRTRRAIAHAVNRTQIAQQLFFGKQPVAHTYLPPRHPGFTDAVQKYRYDPARAHALLRDAGFAPGPDGIMVNAAGQRLSLELNSTEGSRVREQVESLIREQLRQVGIEITILNLPARILFEEFTRARKFKALAMYSWIFSPTDGCDRLYTSDAIPTESDRTGQNVPGYRNPEMDKACKAASRELNEATRNRLLNESARIFSRDLPALPLFFRVEVGAAKAGLKNFRPTAILPIETWNAHKWYWE